MSVPQLYYFSIRGLAEYIRLFLKDNAIQFEDHRFQWEGKEWEKLKNNMIFGQVPCLKMDGQELVQTGAILRHLGRIYKLNGSTEQEATFIDMFFEGLRDLRMKYAGYIYKDSEPRDQHVNVTLPTALEKIESLFKIHPGDFILGEKISYADYPLFEELDAYNTLDSGILSKFPLLKAFHERMWQRPNLKPYLEKRASDKVWINAVPKGSII